MTQSLRSVQDVSFGVFGLGNKQYEHFAAVGKVVHDALLALGASAIVRRGDGDDDADIDEDFELWRADLIKALDDSPLVAVKVLRRGRTAQDAERPCAFGGPQPHCCVGPCFGRSFQRVAHHTQTPDDVSSNSGHHPKV